MRNDEFRKFTKCVINNITDTLIRKGDEYAFGYDRLSAFKEAGQMLGTDAGNALLGMLTKHLVSLFDMTKSGVIFPFELWNEKSIDAINYIILLFAIKAEEIYNAKNQNSDIKS